MTVTAEALPTSAEVEKRVKAASKRIREINEKAEAARIQRDRAVVSLHVHEQWAPVRCYRLVDVSRGLFVRMMDRASKGGDPAKVAKVPRAEKIAVKAARELARYETSLDEQRDIRDSCVEAMLNGRIRTATGAVYRNAELARLTGLTTARIAQLRHGTR